MARTVGSNGAKTAIAIRRAGIRLIYEHGFEAMSLRELAADVGVQPGSLYKYFTNKEGLLVDIMRSHGVRLLDSVETALADVEGPGRRLEAFATFHLSWHRTRHMELQIMNHELRALSPKPRAEMVALRRGYEKFLEDILAAGAELGEFCIQDVRVATFAILAMLTGIGVWYRPGGRLELEKIIQVYLTLITRGVTNPKWDLPASRNSRLEKLEPDYAE